MGGGSASARAGAPRPVAWRPPIPSRGRGTRGGGHPSRLGLVVSGHARERGAPQDRRRLAQGRVEWAPRRTRLSPTPTLPGRGGNLSAGRGAPPHSRGDPHVPRRTGNSCLCGCPGSAAPGHWRMGLERPRGAPECHHLPYPGRTGLLWVRQVPGIRGVPHPDLRARGQGAPFPRPNPCALRNLFGFPVSLPYLPGAPHLSPVSLPVPACPCLSGSPDCIKAPGRLSWKQSVSPSPLSLRFVSEAHGITSGEPRRTVSA